jgi:formate dehydrogenase major subunit
MAKIEVILNGKKVAAETGMTILDLATRYDIEIPTLCHDEELKPYGSCWVCAVEVKGRRGFVTACGTYISEGMEITTSNEEINQARKMALELLISDHYADCEAPCKIACPDHVDVQGYVSLIANGQYHEAVKVIKDTLPMPLSIGRVCPAFCEKECRRQLVEEPIAIRQLKRYAADEDLNDHWNYVPEKQPDKGKKVAIIGAGPSGLTCGYYLTNNGYEVDVFEASPEAGGWLRYGIPEYRLPKAILDKEIELMCTNGMKIHKNTVMGKDIYLDELSRKYDAVYVAIGAQKAVPMPVKGSELQGCYLGVDFLKAHALGNAPKLGKKVAIVGGGNTAIDCARTSVRLGAEVSIIYRRTKEEMPADQFEIDAAEHEGVQFYMLSNPVEYMGENGILKEIKIEKMQLGEPDSSGRRRPEPTGDYFTLQFDSIIAAISQVPETETFSLPENKVEGAVFPISRWSTAIVNEDNMFTGLKNVFAGGDFRRGAATAIEAIADGKTASIMIDKFLQGEAMSPPKARFDSKKAGKVKDISKTEYGQFDCRPRVHMPEIELPKARSSFEEVELGFEQKQAKLEAERCLECGCQVNETCFLRQYATDYEVDPVRFMGSENHHPIDSTHPFILRDANKCVNCGRCIRTCAEIQGAAVLGYIYRGFPTVVAPEFGQSLTETSCESCGKCINVCPVGALVERNLNYKMNPLPKTITIQSCGLCGTGCSIKVETETDKVVRISTPELKDKPIVNAGFNGRNICFNGRFGWQSLFAKERLTQPMQKTKAGWIDISWADAVALIKEKQIATGVRRFEITPFATLEEMLLLKKVAENTKSVLASNDYSPLFTDSLWQTSPEEKPYFQLKKYKTFVVVGKISHTLRTMIRLHQRKGKKLILVNQPECGFNRFAEETYDKLDAVNADTDMLFIYSINHTSEEDAFALWQKALAVNTCECNVLMTSEYPNLTGMLALGINPESTKAGFVFGYGAYPQSAEKGAFKTAVMPFMDEGAPVDLLLPQATYLELEGTAIANAGIVTRFHNPAKSNLFNLLLKAMYELEWISPNWAEPVYWNSKAEQFIQSAKMLIKPEKLQTGKAEPGFVISKSLESLHGLINKKQSGFPKEI